MKNPKLRILILMSFLAWFVSFLGCSGCEPFTGLTGDGQGNDFSSTEMDMQDAIDDAETVYDNDDAENWVDLVDVPEDISDDDNPANPCCVVVEDPVVVDDVSNAWPIIQWTGDHYGLLWCQTDPQLSFRTMTMDGDLSAETGRLNPVSGYRLGGCDMTWNGREFGSVFRLNNSSEPYDTLLGIKLITEDGEFIDGLGVFEVNEATQCCKVDWDGESFGMVWTAPYTGHGYQGVFYARFSDSYDVVQMPDFLTFIPPDTSLILPPEVVWTVDRYVIFFPFNNQVFYYPVDREGHMVEEGTPNALTDGGDVSGEVIISGCSDNVGAAAAVHLSASDTLRFGKVFIDGSPVLYNRDFATASPTPTTVACTGMNHGICWCHDGHPYFGLVDMDGYRTGENILVYEESVECWGCYTVWNGSEFGVVFSGKDTDGSGHVYATRVRPAI